MKIFFYSVLTFVLFSSIYASNRTMPEKTSDMVRSVHFNVRFERGCDSQAVKAIGYAEEAYFMISKSLGVELDYVTDIVLYKDYASFENTHIADIVDEKTFAAFSIPVKRTIVVPLVMSDRQTRENIFHEVCHVFIAKASKQYFFSMPGIPLWFEEGLCEYFSSDFDAIKEALMADYFSCEESAAGLERGFGVVHVYVQGHSFIDYLVREKGENSISRIMLYLRNGMSFDRAIEEVCGKNCLEKFDSYSRAKYSKNPGENAGKILVPDSSMDILSFSHSPDLAMLALIFEGHSDTEVKIISASSGRKIYSDSENFAGNIFVQGYQNQLSWSSDSSKLCYLVVKNNLPFARIYDLKTSKRSDIFLGFHDVAKLKMSPDGGTLYFKAEISSRRCILSYSLRRAEASLLFQSDDDVTDFCVLDGTLYVATRGVNGSRIFSCSVSGLKNEELLKMDCFSINSSGGRIFLCSSNSGDISIYEYIPTEKKLKKIEVADSSAFNPQLCAGKMCYETFSCGRNVLKSSNFSSHDYFPKTENPQSLLLPEYDFSDVVLSPEESDLTVDQAVSLSVLNKDARVFAGTSFSDYLYRYSFTAGGEFRRLHESEDSYCVFGEASLLLGTAEYRASAFYDSERSVDDISCLSSFFNSRSGFAFAGGSVGAFFPFTKFISLDFKFLSGEVGLKDDFLLNSCDLSLVYDNYKGRSGFSSGGFAFSMTSGADRVDSRFYGRFISGVAFSCSASDFTFSFRGDYLHTECGLLPYYLSKNETSGALALLSGRNLARSEIAVNYLAASFSVFGSELFPNDLILRALCRGNSVWDDSSEIKKRYTLSPGFSILSQGESGELSLDCLRMYNYKKSAGWKLLLNAKLNF